MEAHVTGRANRMRCIPFVIGGQIAIVVVWGDSSHITLRILQPEERQCSRIGTHRTWHMQHDHRPHASVYLPRDSDRSQRRATADLAAHPFTASRKPH
jgi:hypothetical protein